MVAVVDMTSEWWRMVNEGQPVSVTETKLKSRLRQLNLREGWFFCQYFPICTFCIFLFLQRLD